MMRPKDLRQGSGTKTFLDAMHSDKVHLARFILDALDGRIINSKTENSRTPLMFAVHLPEPGARTKFTRLLVERGADVNSQDQDGRTALSHACEMGYLEVVKLLVQFNADPDVIDTWGNSALMYAALSGHSQVLEFLVRAFKRLGLRLDRTNNAGHSAIQVADFFGHNQCVQVLNLPCRRSAGKEEKTRVDAGSSAGKGRPPSKLPRHVLERFSKKKEDPLPGVFQRRPKDGDSDGQWKPFRCRRSQTPEDDGHQQAVPHHRERSQSEVHGSVPFTAKQLPNCQLSDTRGSKTLNHITRDGGLPQGKPESFPFWGKAKSFNLDLLSSRKQSYQGDVRDMSLSASKLKRASLQDERSLMDKIERQEENTLGAADDTDKTATAPKSLLNRKGQSARTAPENGRSRQSESNDDDAALFNQREQQKRGSVPPPAPPPGRHGKLLPARGEMDSGKIPAARPPPPPPVITALGSRLLRRFTAPEFMKMVKDCSSAGSARGRGRMSRSETYPFSEAHHQRVNSQPSIDSISGVKCEFESSTC